MRISKHLPLTLFVCSLALALIVGSSYRPPEFDPDTVAFPGTPPVPDWVSEPMPDFRKFDQVDEKKEAFFEYLYPRIRLANSRVLIEREYLLKLKQKTELTGEEFQWIRKQAKRLGLDSTLEPKQLLSQIPAHLDIIPPSLVLAQAANESAWGASRFARQGNNLFGQWCFTVGCGLVPRARPKGEGHEVQVFRTPYHSVRSYVQNLNRHRGYKTLRQMRLKNRSSGQPLNGQALAEGLGAYSERGEDYISEIRSMIRINDLQRYDDRFRQQIADHPIRKLATAREKELSERSERASPQS